MSRASGQRVVNAAQLVPNQILVNVDLQLRAGLSGEQQVETLARIERGIRARHPQAMRVSLQPRNSLQEIQ